MKKTIVALALVLMLVMPLFASALTMSPAGEYPIVDEPLTLTAVAMQTPVQNEYNSVWVFKQYEEKSGVHIEWTNIPSDLRAERLNLMLASLDLPDIIFKMGVSSTQLAQYGAEGVFVDLMQYKDLMPETWNWWTEYPTALDAVTQTDGCIYGTNYILAGYAIRMGSRIYFNTDVMEKAGWDHVPTTTDELIEFFRACKGLDYNENGIADEIPLCLEGAAATNQGNVLDQVFFGGFGLRNVGSSFTYVDRDIENGGLRFIPTSESYRDYLRFTSQMYQEGLIDTDLFTTDFAGLIAKASEGRALSYIFVNNSPVAGSKYEQYTLGMKAPFEGTHNTWTNFSQPASQSGQFVITFENDYPEISARWVDYWYSHQGIVDFFMGEENVTYTYDEATGKYDLTPFVLQNPDGINFEQVLAPWVVWQGGNNPSVTTNELFKGGETWPCSLESAAGLINFVDEANIWAPFNFDSETSTEINVISQDIGNYYREWRAAFWTGAKDLDADWDAYIAGYEALNTEYYMNAYTAKAIEKGLIEG